MSTEEGGGRKGEGLVTGFLAARLLVTSASNREDSSKEVFY